MAFERTEADVTFVVAARTGRFRYAAARVSVLRQICFENCVYSPQPLSIAVCIGILLRKGVLPRS